MVYTFSKEFGDGYGSLTTPSTQNGNHDQTDLHLQNVPKATVGQWYFKKRCKSVSCVFS